MYDRAIPLAPPEGRSAEILALVRKAFAEKGFDGASMQDLARAAGMSVGNFYRYFPSKDAIIEALIGLDLDEVDRDFSAISRSPDPMGALRHVLAHRVEQGGCENEELLWAEIMAAALRKPRIFEATARMEQAIVDRLVAVFQMATQNSSDASATHFATEARMLVFLVKAVSMQTRNGHDDDRMLKARVQRTIDDILNSLSKDA